MSSSKPTLLIVDADPSWRELLRDFFEMNSFRVTLAGSGNDAVKALGSRADLILMDLAFSDKTGSALIQEIHQLNHEYARRILICGNGKVPNEISHLIYSQLPKPIALPLLLSEVTKALNPAP